MLTGTLLLRSRGISRVALGQPKSASSFIGNTTWSGVR
jgi:hypothetical protein